MNRTRIVATSLMIILLVLPLRGEDHSAIPRSANLQTPAGTSITHTPTAQASRVPTPPHAPSTRAAAQHTSSKHAETDYTRFPNLSADARRARFWNEYTPQPQATNPQELCEGTEATSSWWNLRNKLSDYGVNLSIVYTNNPAANPVGGMSQSMTYCDDLSFGMSLDLKKLVGWDGGIFTISAINQTGKSLSDVYIGNIFTVQELFSAQTIMLYALHFEQSWLNDRIALKFGRFAIGDEFAFSPIYTLYMNDGVDNNPLALPNNTDFSTYPWPVTGARLLLRPTDETELRLGITQASDRIFSPAYHGVDFSIRSGDNVFLISQLGWSPQFFKPHKKESTSSKNTQPPTSKEPENKPHYYPGNYWFGAYYTPWRSPQFGTLDLAPNGYGFYWHADQMVFQETPGSPQGLTLWSSFVYSPQENISLIPFQASSGLVYQGLIPRRDTDYTLFAAYYGKLSRNFARTESAQGLGYPVYELVFEWGYRIQLTKFAYVQPDIQWIVNPGGTGLIPNALVLGAQMGVNF